jgi:mannose-1-phosphate guanylyltransferase
MSSAAAHLHALILAGGSGTRFWPLSRNEKPKQLLPLFGDGTLLEQTLDRLDGLVAPEHTLVLTNHTQEAAVREIVGLRLPAENIWAEPAKRDTAPAVALGVALIARRDPEAVMMVLPSDQLIQNTAAFRGVMRDAAATAAATDALVTIGIRPSWPCPSFGYIERGQRAEVPGFDLAHPPSKVTRFREKPSMELAESFLRQGNFCWNAGMFLWSIPTVVGQLAHHAPQLARFIAELRQSNDVAATIASRFPDLTAISIDYALLEKAERVLCIESAFDWDDVGSWVAVSKYLGSVGHGNQCSGAVTELESNHNIVFNARPGSRVALLGVNDLIVVQTDDALLVANRHQADMIKNLCQQLPPELL